VPDFFQRTSFTFSMTVREENMFTTSFRRRLKSGLAALLAAWLIPQTSAAFTIDINSTTDGPMSGAWYNANESGWGLVLSQRADTIFAAMFTYDAQGAATWYTASACYVSRDGCTSDFYAVTGGVAPVAPWVGSNLNVQRVGLFTMNFRDADNGIVNFSINGTNGTKPITRLTWSARQSPASTLAWQKTPELNTNLPAGVEVFRGTGNGLQAVFATLDNAVNPNVEWAAQSIAPGAKTPSEFARDEAKRAYVTINGGYFGASSINQSFSIIVKDGQLAAPGVKQLTRAGGTYFPTRAAFGALPDGRVVATWAYPVGAGNTLYSYPLPSPNDSAKPPRPQPDASFPPAATVWTPAKAIGGGPMLLQHGNKTITAMEEVFDAASGINATGAAPRTAIARLKDNRVAFIVVDGRSSVSRGVTLSELADILLSLGAIDAMNLDGGGSSTMVVNGTVANVPSDGVQRAIPSVVMFRDR
jgi:exopolysaccharide biosynthesis protein